VESVIDWNAVGAVAAVVVLAMAVAGGATTRAKRWREQRRADAADDTDIHTVLFGRPARGPYPPIAGLDVRVPAVETAVQDLAGRMTRVEQGIGQIESSVATLIGRTEENGGGSMKDDLLAIKRKLGIE